MEEPKVMYHGYPPPGGNPPPYSGPQVYPGPGQPTVVVPTMVPVVMASNMGSEPTRMTCPSCQSQIVTRADKVVTLKNHLFAALLCAIGCWPCVCLPYCMDSCLNTDHYCPNCNAYIGSYRN